MGDVRARPSPDRGYNSPPRPERGRRPSFRRTCSRRVRGGGRPDRVRIEVSQDPIDVLTTDIVSIALKQTVWCLVCKEHVDLGQFHHAFDVLSDKVTSAVILEVSTTLVELRGDVVSREPSDSNPSRFNSGARKKMRVRRPVRVAAGSNRFDDVEILVVASDEPRGEREVVV